MFEVVKIRNKFQRYFNHRSFLFLKIIYKKIILLFFIISLFIPLITFATSGACSSHSGVDCAKGWQSDGTVYCNDDDWIDSMVQYEYMIMCEDVSKNSCNGYSPDCKYLQDLDLLKHDREIAMNNINDHIDRVKNGEIKTYSDESKKRILDTLYIHKGRVNVNYMGYICDCKKIDASLLMYQEKYTPAISQDVIDRALSMLGGTTKKDSNSDNKLICPKNSYEKEGKCVCLESYFLENNKCVLRSYKSAVDSILKYWEKTIIAKGIHPDGTLIKTTDHAGVYLIENGKKRAIRSAEIFLAKGYKWEDIVIVSLSEMASYLFGPDVTIDEKKERGELITINTPILNIRSLPGFNGKVIAQTLKGYKHTVQDEENGWYKINFKFTSSNNIKTGWVMSKYTEIIK